ncbi:hypothetical protein M0R45_000396 [Rubus argutus]|uniref:Uncharacterized protein n=1 Tax=Rubus argutus TaxID=59490 RepID=A0AAW1VKU2_RUBAR
MVMAAACGVDGENGGLGCDAGWATAVELRKAGGYGATGRDRRSTGWEQSTMTKKTTPAACSEEARTRIDDEKQGQCGGGFEFVVVGFMNWGRGEFGYGSEE